MSARRLTAAIMISGRGSNMMALVNAAADPAYPVAFTHILSDKPEAPGLAWAQAQGFETEIIDPADALGISTALDNLNVDLVCLAGYMRILPKTVTDRWTGRMLNIHPSLLPKHRGLHAQAQALKVGDTRAGATVHLVNEDVDAGEILSQEHVDVLPDDTVDTLSTRILAVEHVIYPKAVADYAEKLRARGFGS